MFLFAWRHAQLDPVRTLLTGFAIGAVIAVILVLEGFEQGQYDQLERVVLDREADLVAVQPGVANFIAVRSSLPQSARAEVESVPGVAAAHPITAIPVIYSRANARTPMYVFVTDTKGGPGRIAEGRTATEERDIVVDSSLASIHDIQVGDALLVSDFEFRVSGITRDAAAFFTPFAFITYDGMIDFFLDSEIASDISTFPLLSFLLVELESGADRTEVKEAIEGRARSVDVFEPGELALEDVNLGRVLLSPIIGLLVSVGYLIGLLVTGLILYADVAGRLHSFGVLKALGFPSRKLAEAVILEALLLLVIGWPLGMALGQALAGFIDWAAPLYAVRIFEPVLLARTAGASLLFAVLGALIPLRSVRRADPMAAFRRL